MPATAPQTSPVQTVMFDGRRVRYVVKRSKTSTRCRVRVGPAGVEVILPEDDADERACEFLHENSAWVLNQVDRVEGLSAIRLANQPKKQSILLRGEEVPVQVEQRPSRRGTNKVTFDGNRIFILRGRRSDTSPARSLEYWLRQEARRDIEDCLKRRTSDVRRKPNRVYVMGQRTKWGNCSPLGNLSFNWRLIMAPSTVLEYIVVHELVHLAIPDHSPKFWLTVKSLCDETDQSRDWLRRHSAILYEPLEDTIR